MRTMKEFIENIIEGKEGFSLGEPWKYNKNSMGVLIPILRETSMKRNYTTLPEVKEKITFRDTGSIQNIQIEKGVDIPLFIRAGTILKGISGQDRATMHSIMVEPKIQADLDVRCIHASRGIVAGGNFSYDGYVPKAVYQSLHSGNQSQVWGSVGRTYQTMKAKSMFCGMAANIGNVKEDSLPEIKDAMKKMDSKMQDILSQVPVLENQIGGIVVGMEGVMGIEVFDHPASWKAQYKEVIEKYSDDLSQEAKLFTFDDTQIMAVVRTFLKEVAGSSLSTIYKNSFSIIMSGFIGELVIVKDDVIHLFLLKKDKEQEEPSYPPFERRQRHIAYGYQTVGSANPIYRATMFKGMKKGYENIAKTMGKYGGATWTELEKESKLSTATLNERLKEGKQIGVFEDGLRKNGKKVYKLSGDLEYQ